MPNYTGGMAVCPFYGRESQRSICCGDENSLSVYGGVDLTRTQIALRFDSSKKKVEFQKKYCLRFNYPCCPVAKVLISREQ